MSEVEPSSGRWRLLWTVAQKATPVTILVLVVLFSVQTRYLLTQQDRERESKAELVRLLLAEQAAHLALALRCAPMEGMPRAEGQR